MRIVHIADVHWRGLSRHDEYILAFKDFFKQVEALKPDIIYVGGDIVHSKTQGISPEVIQSLTWWFRKLASICPTHIILGNHDGLILNKDRQDAITPIIAAIDNPNLHLYKDSGIYDTGYPGFKWCVFSCFDEENWASITPNPSDVNIALYHGAVRGSLTDVDWQLEGEINSNFFKGFDYALLGDIHKRQFLNKEKTIAYCGSTIQQNYGESRDKGFLLWDIRSRDDFDVKFYEVKNIYPFITIDWAGSLEATIKSCKKHPRQSRFRIRADNFIPQSDAKRIQKLLKKSHNAKEVVFKIESKFEAERIINNGSENSLNLRSSETHIDLLSSYYKNHNLKEEEWAILKDMTEKYVNQIASQDCERRNVKWTINSMKFDNMFAYGENNYINFESLPGITGIFGKNARGKSSIIGSLAYGLFNTTDRGSIKNIHVINTRRNSCNTEIDVSISGSKYRIVRSTIKKQTKKDTWAPTTLKFYRIDNSGNIIEDLTEEQRRETEKILRRIIGTSEEFMLTSLASQGEINNFIKEKAAARKNILSNFLDLEVFEKINEMAKKDSANSRSLINTLTGENWDQKLELCLLKIDEHLCDKASIENKIIELREELDKTKASLHKLGNEDIVSSFEIEELDNKIKRLDKTIASDLAKKQKISKEIFEQEEKINKIQLFVDNFDLQKIKEKKAAKTRIKHNLIELQGSLNLERNELKQIEKSVGILDQVPCGDKFLQCKFIKESHKNKRKLDSQQKKVTFLSVKIDDISNELENLSEDFESKLEKYSQIVQKKSELISEIANHKVLIERVDQLIIKNNEELLTLKKEKLTLDNRFAQQDADDPTLFLKEQIATINNKIKKEDTDRNKSINLLASWRAKRDICKKNKADYEKLRKDLRLFDMFIQATSKKGIPVQLIHTLLPNINIEITKILQGVVGFTVALEANLENNSMDIYIDYGDSKRIIELASGMEKMMASLAIRVALINISTLPKTNMLIIDEGFGSLDETNLESCSKLLLSFKKWFRNIIIISHIDAIKDVVDNSIEITKNGVDSHVYSI